MKDKELSYRRPEDFEPLKKGGFRYYTDGVDKGKGLTALEDSDAGRVFLKQLFGKYLPSSIMKAEKAQVMASIDEPTSKRSYSTSGIIAKRGKKEFGENGQTSDKKKYGISGQGCAGGALSTFPQGIGRSMVLLYSEPGHTVFDPFAGHNSRMDLCVKAGRHYVGCDLSTDFMEFNNKRRLKLMELYPEARIKLHHCDSRKVPVKDESAHMTITSPPYWDIEYYGDEPEQLGKTQTYEEFLHELGKVVKENFRVLKPGSYAAWFINDFRRKGKMHFYHIDLLKLGEKAGFIAHDILIVDFLRGFREVFINQTIKSKILPKRHEYGIIFKKPA